MRTATNSVCVECGMDAPVYDAEGRCSWCSPVLTAGNGAILPVDSPTTGKTNNPPSELQKRAQALIHEHGGVRAAALALSDEIGRAVNHGVLSMAARGQDSPAARRALGLPPPIPVEPCPDCGRVHRQLATCAPKPRRATKRRRSVWLEPDEADAWDATAIDDGFDATPDMIRAAVLEKYPHLALEE